MRTGRKGQVGYCETAMVAAILTVGLFDYMLAVHIIYKHLFWHHIKFLISETLHLPSVR